MDHTSTSLSDSFAAQTEKFDNAVPQSLMLCLYFPTNKGKTEQTHVRQFII